MKKIIWVLCAAFMGVALVTSCDKDSEEIDSEQNTEDIVDPEVDAIVFSDSSFKAALLQAGNDSNGDSEISEEEAAVVTSIDVSQNSDIMSLAELSYFTALTNLNCSATSILSLDVSSNVLLEALNCSSTNIGSGTRATESDLDLSENTKLKSLDISDTNIVTIDVSSNVELEELNASSTAITDIDVSNNTALRSLNVSSTSITDLDVSNNSSLSDLSAVDCEDLSNVTYSDQQDTSNWEIEESVETTEVTTPTVDDEGETETETDSTQDFASGGGLSDNNTN